LRGALAAGKDQAGAGFEVLDGANFDGICTQGFESVGVGFEVTLDSEDADFHGSFAQTSLVNELRLAGCKLLGLTDLLDHRDMMHPQRRKPQFAFR